MFKLLKKVIKRLTINCIFSFIFIFIPSPYWRNSKVNIALHQVPNQYIVGLSNKNTGRVEQIMCKIIVQIICVLRGGEF